MVKKILFIIIVLLVFNFTFGNNTLYDSIIYKNIEDAVSKNIFIYRVKNTYMVESKLNGRFFAVQSSFSGIKPDCDCKLILKIEKANIEYPDPTVTLYSVYKGSETYDCGLYVLSKEPGYFFSPDRYFLVGVYPSGFIIFISGNFYLHSIKDNFSLDFNMPESFYYYIKLKTFSFQTKDVEFVKKKGKNLIFKAYSEELKKNITIIINKRDLDIVTVRW